MRHFISCDLCGALGHKAKDCSVNQLEQLKDPIGELLRRQGYRQREKERLAKRQGNTVTANVQTSRGFGL